MCSLLVVCVYVDVVCISLYDCMCGGPQEEKLMQMLTLKVDPDKKETTTALSLMLLSQRNEFFAAAVVDVCQSQSCASVTHLLKKLNKSVKAPEPSLNSLRLVSVFYWNALRTLSLYSSDGKLAN